MEATQLMIKKRIRVYTINYEIGSATTKAYINSALSILKNPPADMELKYLIENCERSRDKENLRAKWREYNFLKDGK